MAREAATYVAERVESKSSLCSCAAILLIDVNLAASRRANPFSVVCFASSRRRRGGRGGDQLACVRHSCVPGGCTTAAQLPQRERRHQKDQKFRKLLAVDAVSGEPVSALLPPSSRRAAKPPCAFLSPFGRSPGFSLKTRISNLPDRTVSACQPDECGRDQTVMVPRLAAAAF